MVFDFISISQIEAKDLPMCLSVSYSNSWVLNPMQILLQNTLAITRKPTT